VTGKADLVLEGGGVKGIALVGAISVIQERGYEVARVAGTSAGSIVGAFVAAGLRGSELVALMKSVDYARFRDESLLGRIPLVGKPLSLLLHQGIYDGRFAREWVTDRLAEHGVRTFADLPYRDDEYAPPPEKRYRLIVMASDISQGSLRRFPWDYRHYDCEPGEQAVADAVRASMSIPFFFQPVTLTAKATGEKCVLVDGGMLSNFPVDVFDAPADREPRWPTFGVKLSARAATAGRIVNKVNGTVSMTKAMVGTMTSFYDRLHVDQESVQAQTIFVDTEGVSSTDFGLSPETQQRLYENGRKAALKFFDGGDGREPWDWEQYKAKYRPVRTGTPGP
jgi:NTE family protein